MKNNTIKILLILCITSLIKAGYCANQAVACNVIDNAKSVEFGLSPNAIDLARSMLNREFGDWKKLCVYSEVDLAKRLNALVYNVCVSPDKDNQGTNINDLFQNCKTMCGGRAYVFRGLMAVYGIHSRLLNIYNIPKQGNHTTVEILDNQTYAFFDPTFGVYFAAGIAATPLNLQAVQYYLDEKKLKSFVYQAKKINQATLFLSDDLNILYENKFNSKRMDLSSYVDAESIAPPDAENILYLSANMALKNNQASVGCLEAKSKEEAFTCFLNQTNQLYSNKNPRSYISFVMSYLGYLQTQMKLDAFNLSNLSQGEFYKVELLIDSANKEITQLKVGAVGSGLVLPLKSVTIQLHPGLSRYEVFFKAKAKTGTLLLYPIPGKIWSANLFALKITKDLHSPKVL